MAGHAAHDHKVRFQLFARPWFGMIRCVFIVEANISACVSAVRITLDYSLATGVSNRWNSLTRKQDNGERAPGKQHVNGCRLLEKG